MNQITVRPLAFVSTDTLATASGYGMFAAGRSDVRLMIHTDGRVTVNEKEATDAEVGAAFREWGRRLMSDRQSVLGAVFR